MMPVRGHTTCVIGGLYMTSIISRCLQCYAWRCQLHSLFLLKCCTAESTRDTALLM